LHRGVWEGVGREWGEKEGRREGGKEGRREGGKEGRREGGKEGRKGCANHLGGSSPSTLNPQLARLNSLGSTLDPPHQPSTLNPQPSTPNPQPATRNAQRPTLDPDPAHRKQELLRLQRQLEDMQAAKDSARAPVCREPRNVL